MRLDFYISPYETNKFAASCEIAIYNIGNAAKWITEASCQDILEESLKQVPRDSGTLASTGFYEVQRNTATKRYTYFGVVGYAGMAGSGKSHDAINPFTGAPASSYAMIVHEDLSAEHDEHLGQKAKFLEDPVRDYFDGEYARVAEKYFGYAIQKSNAGATYIPTRL